MTSASVAASLQWQPPTVTERRVIAVFNPQAWLNDYAISVDPEGDTAFDVTPELLAMGREAALDLDDNDEDRDDLRDAAGAPKWIKDWSGPFEVEIDFEEVKALFDGGTGDGVTA